MTDKIGFFYLSNAGFHTVFKPYNKPVRLVPSPKDPDLGVLLQDSMGKVEGSTQRASPVGAMHPLVVSCHSGCLGRMWLSVGAC